MQEDHLREQGHIESGYYAEEAVSEIFPVKDLFFGHIPPFDLEIHDKTAYDKEEVDPAPAKQE